MARKVGPLLEYAIGKLAAMPRGGAAELAMASHLGMRDDGERLPVVVNLHEAGPRAGETWPEYKNRIDETLSRFGDGMRGTLGVEAEPLYLSNAVRSAIAPDQVGPLADNEDVRLLELDPLVQVTSMDDAIDDVRLDAFLAAHPDSGGSDLNGAGVRVAVLDSGIDTELPFLRVADSVSTSDEGFDVPGSHGTHCAGSIASHDTAFRGIAPGVTLINIKVLTREGLGNPTNITQGIDAALDRNAEVLSMSLGFNHLPRWSDSGHGWSCPDGRCTLCTAVNNAVALGVVVVVAAGNEHIKAENLRNFGAANSFDTELGCPGQAASAITVAALTKRTFLPAGFSSRGPASYDDIKPDISGPGVNITSTVPVPRQANGDLIANPGRDQLFGRKSGTSMATPIVAGAVALLVQQFKDQGRNWTPDSIRNELLTQRLTAMGLPARLVGEGRLDLAAT